MDGPTLDVMDGPYEEEEGEDEVDFCSPPWGRLFPLNKCFAAQGSSPPTNLHLMTRVLCRFGNGGILIW